MNHRASICLAVAPVAAALALAACGGSSHPTTTTVATAATNTTTAQTVTSTSTSTVAAAPTTTASSGGSAPAGATGGSAPSASSGVPAGCTPDDLGIHQGPSNGAAGTIYVEYDFVNVSSHSCTLKGYPGVSLVLANGSVDAITNVRSPGSEPLVTLPANGSAPFSVGYVGSAAPGCVEATHIRFIPPNDTAPEQLAQHIQACGGKVDVTAVGHAS